MVQANFFRRKRRHYRQHTDAIRKTNCCTSRVQAVCRGIEYAERPIFDKNTLGHVYSIPLPPQNSSVIVKDVPQGKKRSQMGRDEICSLSLAEIRLLHTRPVVKC